MHLGVELGGVIVPDQGNDQRLAGIDGQFVHIVFSGLQTFGVVVQPHAPVVAVEIQHAFEQHAAPTLILVGEIATGAGAVDFMRAGNHHRLDQRRRGIGHREDLVLDAEGIETALQVFANQCGQAGGGR